MVHPRPTHHLVTTTAAITDYARSIMDRLPPVILAVALGMIAARFLGLNPLAVLAGFTMFGLAIVMIAACG